jgi:DNA polymerase-3 subunit beta
MKVICDKEKLLIGINVVQKAVSSKSTLPILEGILIETQEQSIKLTGNDLELGIEYIVECEVKEKGSTVVDARMFGEIIRKLPDYSIEITVDENNLMKIECFDSYYKLSTMNSEEFPKLPELNINQSLKIRQNLLKDMLKRVVFAVSVDENRPIFTGCLIDSSKGELNIVAVDGFRLALQNYKQENSQDEFRAIIPGRILNEIIKILDENEEEMNIGLSKNQAVFEMKNCRAVTRILEGEFLNYKNTIPVEKDTRVAVKTNNILMALERVSLITKEEKKYPVKMSIDSNKMVITCNVETGDAREEMPIDKNGKNIEIGFNPRYFLDSLKSIKEEEINIDFGTNISPCVIRPVEGEGFIHMILPVRIKEEA